MLLAFPVVLGVVGAAMDVGTQYILTIENSSRSTVKDLVVSTSDFQDRIAQVVPGQRFRRIYHFSADGSMVFTATVRGRKTSGTVEGYVTGGWSGNTRLSFPEDKPLVVSGRGHD